MIDLNNDLTLKQLHKILFNDEKICISESSIKRVNQSFEFLEKFSKDKIIYGINTGLGPMTQYRINPEKLKELQYNLIRSHCSGTSRALPGMYVKSAMLARVKALTKGYSGIHLEATEMLITLINNDIYPFIPEHGSVGASGDLVQLSHIALVMIGEGEVFYKDELLPTKTVFDKLKIKPISVYVREGLGLINGTSVMTGIAGINLIYSKNILKWMVLASSIMNEVVSSFDDYFSPELNRVKLHKGQQNIAESIHKILSKSKLIKKRPEHLYDQKIEKEIFEEKIQEYYSIRCVPQILGPIFDTIINAEKVVLEEFESVSDNPIIDVENQNVYHGGNFHGDYISFEMDKLKIAIAKLSLLSERQLNYILNNNLNCKFPPFINLGTLGLNLGMQGIQFTATSTAAENQTLSYPMYLHTIPNNNDNQDIVSMGTNSALLAKRVIENSFEVIAIEFMALLQVIDYLKCQDGMSAITRKAYDDLRKIVPVFIEDTPKYKAIEALKQYMMSTMLDFEIKEA